MVSAAGHQERQALPVQANECSQPMCRFEARTLRALLAQMLLARMRLELELVARQWTEFHDSTRPIGRLRRLQMLYRFAECALPFVEQLPMLAVVLIQQRPLGQPRCWLALVPFARL
jgi:hypothetical protein